MGSFGHGAFSLYATKNMTTGEGGLITTDDDALADRIRLYRNQGMRAALSPRDPGVQLPDDRHRRGDRSVPTRQARAGIDRRRAIAARYDAAFEDLPIRVPITPPDRTHVYHQYTIDVGPARDAFVADLAEAGVATGIYYPIPVHRQPYVLERGIDVHLPVTEQVADRAVSIPVYPTLTDDEVTTVIDAVRAAVGRHVGATAR